METLNDTIPKEIRDLLDEMMRLGDLIRDLEPQEKELKRLRDEQKIISDLIESWTRSSENINFNRRHT